MNATLNNTSCNNNTKETTGETKKEVMRTQPFPAVVGAGTMVEYGASRPDSSGLIPASQGYGTGPAMQQPHPYYHARVPMQSFQRPVNMSQVY